MTGFPGGSAIKNPPANAEDEGWILGWDPNSEKTTTTTTKPFLVEFSWFSELISRLTTPDS